MGSVAARFRRSVVRGVDRVRLWSWQKVGPTDARVPPNPAVQGTRRVASSFFAGVVAGATLTLVVSRMGYLAE